MMALKLRFGQYKGRAVDNVPSNYLRWILTDFENLHPALKADIERVLQQRKAEQRSQPEAGANKPRTRERRVQ